MEIARESLLTYVTDSNVARRLLSTLRIGVLRGGCEVEVLKAETEGSHLE
jgi:hypothetical protein